MAGWLRSDKRTEAQPKRGERGSRSGPLATTVVCFRGCMQEMVAVAHACGGPTPVTQGSVYRRRYRALQSSGLGVQRSSRQDQFGGVLRSSRNKQVVVMVDHFLT
jgi:hypothetical protein